jgi:hypothetical protein
MKNYILIGCILLLTVSLFFSVKEGADNQNTQNNEPQVPEKLRALEETYKKKIYETVTEIVNKGLNEEFIKTPSCKAECVLDEEKIRRSLSVIDQAHVVLIISFLYNLLNDDASLKFITGMLGPNSQLVNRPPINVTKEELRVVVIIINNLKKNKNFMSLLNKVNNLVKT